VLYVEDDDGLREIITEILADAGYEVQTRNDGREGLACIQERPRDFDLLISDIRMPVMDGLEMVRRLDGTDFKAPIILFSAFDAAFYEADTIGLKITAKVQKGDIVTLLGAVAAALA
jgi:CheY-like chemotaxis protein